MSEFEKYLSNHKSKIDLDQVNPEIWLAVENHESLHFTKSRFKNIWIYAGLIIGFITIACLYLNNSADQIPTKLLQEHGFENAQVAENIDSKLNLIKGTSIPIAYKKDFEQLLDEVELLDAHFKEKIIQWRQNKKEQELTIEVLKYYETKREILDNMINEIQKINNNIKTYEIKSEHTYIEM